MQGIAAVLLTFALGSITLIADPLLTAPGSGAFEYTFSGNTVAEFGATELFVPGRYDYPFLSTYPFPYPPNFIHSVILSSSGVWTFLSQSSPCCMWEWILTPALTKVPGLGKTVYDLAVDDFFFDTELQSSRVVPGTATLTISAVPEPATLKTVQWGLGVVCLSAVAWRKRIARRI
jgi:hypothetical protein